MRSKVHIRRGDTVMVLCGKDRGKRGKVLNVLPDRGMAVVEHVNVVKRHTKARAADQEGGIISLNAPVDHSNLMLVCPRCGKATRIGRQRPEDVPARRTCKKCGKPID